jgi:hypothetical protein
MVKLKVIWPLLSMRVINILQIRKGFVNLQDAKN